MCVYMQNAKTLCRELWNLPSVRGRCQTTNKNRFVKFLNSKCKHVILQGECLSSIRTWNILHIVNDMCFDVKIKNKIRTKKTVIGFLIWIEIIRNQMTRINISGREKSVNVLEVFLAHFSCFSDWFWNNFLLSGVFENDRNK